MDKTLTFYAIYRKSTGRLFRRYPAGVEVGLCATVALSRDDLTEFAHAPLFSSREEAQDFVSTHQRLFVRQDDVEVVRLTMTAHAVEDSSDIAACVRRVRHTTWQPRKPDKVVSISDAVARAGRESYCLDED